MSDLFDSKNASPMLLKMTQPFDDDGYIFELKLDGVRCLAYLDCNGVTLRNKRNKDVTDIYPELRDMYRQAKLRCVLDGELVALGKDGKPDFFALQRRSLMTDSFRIELAAKQNAVQFVAYDILYLDNTELTSVPLLKRKQQLADNLTEGHGLSISRYIEKEGIAFFELAKAQGLEGIVAKKKDGVYLMGKRCSEWVKIKVMQDEDLVVCGYKEKENGGIKDVILGIYDDDGRLLPRGSVSLGISKEDEQAILHFAKDNTVYVPWFADKRDVHWLKPQLVGTAHYMQKTEKGNMRQPVWKGLRNDKEAKECRE